ncbi:MAG: redoxin family protein [Candidatus Eisenbacteria bacterium]
MRLLRRSHPALTAALLVATLLVSPAHAAGASAPPAAKRAPRAAAAAAADSPAARKALAAVVERYRTLTSYRLEGVATSDAGNAEASNVTHTSLQFAVQRPGRFSSRVRNTEMDTRMISDGDTLWTIVPGIGQYQVQAMATLRASADSLALSRQFDPAGEYARLLDGVTAVRALGRDTVHTARGTVACERYSLVAPNEQAAAQGVTMSPRVVWVDPASHMVYMDSVRLEQKQAQLGAVHAINVTRMIVADANPELPAGLFRYTNAEGLRRVRRFMRNSPEHSAMEGQAAKDFTLEPLGGGTAVKLSSLKGKVVVLDFWATWCGPCRGWLPIVAKVSRDYAAKGVVVYAVNEREDETKVRAYLDKQKLDVPVLMDLSGMVGQQYRASSIPLTVVIGRDGQVFRVLLGLHGEDDLRDVLNEAGID